MAFLVAGRAMTLVAAAGAALVLAASPALAAVTATIDGGHRHDHKQRQRPT